jgi:hypothetical protein
MFLYSHEKCILHTIKYLSNSKADQYTISNEW